MTKPTTANNDVNPVIIKKPTWIRAAIRRVLFFRESAAWQVLAEAWVVQNEAGQPLKRTEAERQFLPSVLELQERPTSPLGRILGRVIMLFLIVGLLWMAFAPRAIHVVMAGKIVPPSYVQVIESLESAIIKIVHVRNGAHVQQGDLLLTMDPTEIIAERVRLERELQTAQLDVVRLLATLNNLLTGQAPNSTLFDAAEKSERDRQWGFLRSTLAGSQAKKTSLVSDEKRFAAQAEKLKKVILERRKLVDAARQKFNMYDSLRGHGDKALSLGALLRAQQEHVREIAGLAEAEGALREAEESIQGTVYKQVESHEKALQQTHRKLAEAHSRMRLAEQELIKAQKREARSRLKAPVAGTVANMAVHAAGEVVQTGERLMTVVPTGVVLEIEAMMKNKDRGNAWVEQPARIKVAAYPFTKYGVLSGAIAHISSDAIEVEGQGLMFPVRIRLLEQTIHVRGRDVPLEVGMSVTAEVQTGSQTVLQYLLTPLARIADEAMHER